MAGLDANDAGPFARRRGCRNGVKLSIRMNRFWRLLAKSLRWRKVLLSLHADRLGSSANTARISRRRILDNRNRLAFAARLR